MCKFTLSITVYKVVNKLKFSLLNIITSDKIIIIICSKIRQSAIPCAELVENSQTDRHNFSRWVDCKRGTFRAKLTVLVGVTMYQIITSVAVSR